MTERPELCELDSPTGIHSHVRYAFAGAFVAGKRVLDIACGNGLGTVLLAESAASVVGADTSREAVETARSRFSRPNVTYHQLSGSILPLADEEFDVVVCLETLEHLAEPEQPRFLAELRRVLKDDGLIVLSTPDRDTERRYQLATGTSNPWHLHTPARAELREKLAPFGEALAFVQADLICTALVPPATATTVEMEPPFPAIRSPIAVLHLCSRVPPSVPSPLPAIARHEPRLEPVDADMDELPYRARHVSSARDGEARAGSREWWHRRALPPPAPGGTTEMFLADIVVTAILPVSGDARVRVELDARTAGTGQRLSTAGPGQRPLVLARGDFQYEATMAEVLRAPAPGDLSGFDPSDARDVLAARLWRVQRDLSAELAHASARLRALEDRADALERERPLLSLRVWLRWMRDVFNLR